MRTAPCSASLLNFLKLLGYDSSNRLFVALLLGSLLAGTYGIIDEVVVYFNGV